MNLKLLIINKLKQLKVNYKQTGDNFFLVNCLNPEHDDKHESMWINFETGFGECFGCGYKVNKNFWLDNVNFSDEELYEIQQQTKYNNLLQQLTNQEQIKTKSFVLPPRNEELPKKWRGLNFQTIKKYDLYVCRRGLYKDRVIFPFYNDENICIGYNTRAYDKNLEPKYLYAKGLDLKSLIYPRIDLNQNEIYLVEGIMDALSLYQLNIQAIANFGLAVNFNSYKISYLLKKGIDTIYIMLDNDKRGQEAIRKFFKSDLKNWFDLKLAISSKKPLIKEYYNSRQKDFNDFLQLLYS